MNAFSRVVIAGFLACAGTGTAQGQTPLWVAPGLSFEGTDPFWNFGPGGNPVLQGLSTHAKPLYAISAQKLPSDPPGQWTVTLTVRTLQGYGNPQYTGFILAKWSPSAATPLVLTREADAVNGAFVDYNLHLEPITRDASGRTVGGRFAVFDRFNVVGGTLQHVGVFVATRTDDTSPFGAPVPVAGLRGVRDFADPALGYLGGRLKLFYAGFGPDSEGDEVPGILMDDLLDVTTNPRVAGNPELVDAPAMTAVWPEARSHSPIPITGADGDVEGLFVAEGDESIGISNIYFTADLDPATPHVQTLSTPPSPANWLNSGGVAGGTVMVVTTLIPSTVHAGQGAWLLGDDVAPGATAHLTLSAYSAPGRGPATTAVFLGAGWLARPLPFPPSHGSLAISSPVLLASGTIADADQRIAFALPIPPIPGLSGVDVPIQGIASFSLVPTGTVTTLTNSAAIRIR